jgi:hypothetical protein
LEAINAASALDDLDSRSIQTSSDRPGPSLHNTAAATSLTSFINVSGQPKSRKREQKLFPAKSYMPVRYRSFGRFFGGRTPVRAVKKTPQNPSLASQARFLIRVSRGERRFTCGGGSKDEPSHHRCS